MQDYGNFVPGALNQSLDASLAALGRKLDLFPMDNHYDSGVDGILRGTHVLSETYAYLTNLQIQYNITRLTYLMKEQARGTPRPIQVIILIKNKIRKSVLTLSSRAGVQRARVVVPA